MRLRYSAFLVVSALALSAASAIADTAFTVTLSGANEVPPNASPATGSGVLILNSAQTQLSWTITQNVVNAVAGHIHNAPAGSNGPIVIPFPSIVSPIIGSAAMPGIQTVNVTLNGTQEVPANGSTATGAATLTFNANPSHLVLNMTHNVVNQTAAHVHGAPPGVNGPILFGIGVGSPISIDQVMTVAQTISMFSDATYINVHSTAFPGGEIRGNISFPPSLLKELFGNRLYVNIHSTAFPGGEIRGQIGFDDPPVPNVSSSWGRLKKLYR